MNTYKAAFERYIQEHPINYGDADTNSLMEMFYNHYAEFNSMETEKIRACFREIEGMLGPLAEEKMGAVFNCICALCIEQERAAFLEGMRAGGQWMLEMMDVVVHFNKDSEQNGNK